MKSLVKKYFKNFAYFYRYLHYRVFVLVGLTLLFGVMDGLGLSMFLPLFQIASDKMENGHTAKPTDGNGSFLIQLFESCHIDFTLLNMLFLMVFFFVLKGIFYYIKGLYDAQISRFFIISMRSSLLDRFSKLSFKYFISSDVGRIQNLMTSEVNMLLYAFRDYLGVLQNAIMVLVYMGFAFAMNAQFAVLIVIGGLTFNFIFQKIYKITKEASRKLVSAGNSYQGLIIQLVTNFKYLKATGRIKDYVKKIGYQIVDIEDINFRIGKLNAVTNAIREPILVAIVAGVIVLQVYGMGGKLSTIIVSLLFFYRALASVTNFQGSYNSFVGKVGTMENIAIFQDELTQHPEPSGAQLFNGLNQILHLQNVNFFYGTTQILHNINLSLNKNETIAFVGESGSGKTTIVNILSGLLDATNGEYLIDTTSISSIDKQSYQSKIGYISQDPVIFNDTIYNNVTLWDEKNDENMARFNLAIEKAQLHSFIVGIEDHENQVLGNNGINLSGGQKQRISIARELYKNVEILILDEATSALDSETEKYIQQNIDALKGQYTIIIVAHRLSTIKNADSIVLMDKGQITGKGNFESLKLDSPRFKHMVELQEL